MVRRGFGADGFHGAQLAAAVRGYAVLIPNTRGRAGYGPAFERAIGTEKERGRGPLEDALGGVDLLVSRGIADSTRTGVLGHSYGGYMTAYTITQTNRFKAAVIHEGGPLYLMTRGYYGFQPGQWRELLARDLYGVHNPFDPAERTRMMNESPGLNAERVKTPTLLQYGARAAAEDDGIPFYNALRRFNVPAAIFVYDEGHVFSRPAAVADDLTRTLEWLDFWVRGIPFPDAARAAEYEAWKKKSHR
jgi:dipeptidyl aminopeptidase/acylaminoacyl peptidase